MKLRNIKILVSGVILLAAFITTSAQESSTMYFMKGMYQSSMFNPALHNDSSAVVIGLPGLSGVYVDLNGDFAFNDLIHYGTGSMADSLIFDLDGFESSLKDGKTSYFRQNLDVSVFYLGFRTSKFFFDVSVREKEASRSGFGKGFVTFLKEGNASYLGESFDLGDMDMDLYHYREYALGVSTDFMDGRLSVGAKIKALYGKFAVQTERLNFQVETAADGSSLELKTDMLVNFSAPFTLEYDENNFLNGFEEDFSANDYLFNTDNMGMAFDLGAVFKVNDKITVSASIVDIGKVGFETDAHTITLKNSYTWEGLDFSNSLDDTDPNYISADDMIDNELDKLEAVVRPKQSNVSSGTFDLPIPTKVYIGGSYDVNSNLNVGLVDRMVMYEGETTNSITLSANTMVGNFLSISGSYSAINGSYNNLGLGLALRGGPFQFFMVSDNLLALSNPAKAQNVNVRFGLSLLFGRNYSKYVYKN